MVCRSFTSSPHTSDDEAGDYEGSDVEDVGGHDGNIVDALLGSGLGEGVLGVDRGGDGGEAECYNSFNKKLIHLLLLT